MELKVWVEGIQRIVCGVTVNTTCQDVVFALAHATGKVGRFTLIERWRNNERLLAPHENPLKILLKWGEYSNDVQFILQRSSDQSKTDGKIPATTSAVAVVPTGTTKQQQPQQQQQQQPTVKLKQSNDVDQIMKSSTDFLPLDRTKDTRKSFGITETKPAENVGIVRGIPQKPIAHTSPQKINKIDSSSAAQKTPSPLLLSPILNSPPNDDDNIKKAIEFNMADVRNSLDRKTNQILSHEIKNLSNENLLDVFNCNKYNNINNSNNNNNNDLYKTSPPISSNGALCPPPYRDPPPPRNSPLHKSENSFSAGSSIGSQISQFQQKDNMMSYINMHDFGDLNENNFQNAQYKDLIQLIKFQREKISSQQADLTKFDAEIVYLESKERDQAQELEALSREINKTDQIYRQGNDQLQTLQYVEEENELVRQQEKTLKSEITLLRSKLANCETELLQCKNKIRLLMDDIQIEQRALNNRQKDTNRQHMERHFMSEVDKIQAEIDQVIQNAETSNKTTENLKKEIAIIETAIAEKKKQVEQLVNEMKEVNLQSLTVAPADEIHHLLEGSNRPGSTRRIIGSPRQLENAVPTSKNPHGVWV